jgi:hypothetical protein
MLEKSGLNSYLGVSEKAKKFMMNRMIFGYLSKRSKGKIKYFMKRWFVLISAKPLKQDNILEDEEILQDTQL